MRRRTLSNAPSTPAEVVSLHQRAKSDARELHLDPEQSRRYVADALAQAGTDVVQAIRARMWLRRGWSGDDWRG